MHNSDDIKTFPSETSCYNTHQTNLEYLNYTNRFSKKHFVDFWLLPLNIKNYIVEYNQEKGNGAVCDFVFFSISMLISFSYVLLHLTFPLLSNLSLMCRILRLIHLSFSCLSSLLFMRYFFSKHYLSDVKYRSCSHLCDNVNILI